MKDSTMMKICIAAIIISTSMFLVGLVVSYIAVDRTSPSVNEESVPPPKPL